MRDDETVRIRFGKTVADAARRAGFDIDSQRGGGKARLARATGMSESSVGRMLAGKILPDARFFESIAEAVGLDVRELLIEAQIIRPETLTPGTGTDTPQVRSRHITPAQAATELGIFDPVDREMFLGMVDRLTRRQHDRDGAAGDEGEGGGETAQYS